MLSNIFLRACQIIGILSVIVGGVVFMACVARGFDGPVTESIFTFVLGIVTLVLYSWVTEDEGVECIESSLQRVESNTTLLTYKPRTTSKLFW